MGTQEHPRHNGHPAGPRRVTGTAADPPRARKTNPTRGSLGSEFTVAALQTLGRPYSSRRKGAHEGRCVRRRGQGGASSQTNPPRTGRVRRSSAVLLPCLGRRAERHHQQTPRPRAPPALRPRRHNTQPLTRSFFSGKGKQVLNRKQIFYWASLRGIPPSKNNLLKGSSLRPQESLPNQASLPPALPALFRSVFFFFGI